MTREAINRRLALVVAVHAEAHVHVDVAFGDRLLVDRAMTRRAVDVGANVRRVVEANVRLGRIGEHASPHEVLTALAHRRNLSDSRPFRRDGVVADHAGADARQPGHRAGRYRLVTVLRATDFAANVNDVWKLDGLFRARLVTTAEVLERLCEAGAGGSKDTAALPGQRRRTRW